MVLPASSTSPARLEEALRHHRAGRLLEAAEAYRQLLRADPVDADALLLLGIVARQSKHPKQAIALTQAAVRLKPQAAHYHLNLGHAFGSSGDVPNTIRSYRNAIALSPSGSPARVCLAGFLFEQGDFAAAEAEYRQALQQRPGCAWTAANLGSTLLKQRRTIDAMLVFLHALRLDPRCYTARHGLGCALAKTDRLAAAEACFHQAIALRPRRAEPWNSLGNVLYQQRKSEEAAHAYCRALALEPGYARASVNLGNSLLAMGRLADARACYESGLKLDPASPGARYNLALAQLREGEFHEGWGNYESRWDFDELRMRRRDFSQPMWQGDPLAGRTILLHAEQGIGDTIQFARFVPAVAAMGGKVILETQPPLVKLLAGLEGVSAIFSRGQTLPPFDLHCPLMSLPYLLATGIATIPAASGYLAPAACEIEEAQRRYGGKGLRVGLAWAGNPKYKSDFQRSVSLDVLLPLGEVEGLSLFSLQKGTATQQIAPLADRWSLLDASATHKSMAETAALIATLDAVVSIDTSIAHLAGAMNKPTFLLLAHLADWRWMEERLDTPWYGSVRLFRQATPGEWQGVVQQIADALRSMRNAAAAGP
ncbi:tetratricopeptide repeat protein [Silvibacterium acidisoli]|uniref:tetratricopeptide repeat protein n=1 Tax=Acidobacteriaceae bacterium ZG23-2 TaxID=2883246 RepID=UPI00406C87AD